MEAFAPACTADICRALERLTQAKGVHLEPGDVVVKNAASRQTGKMMYVIVAMASIERAVGNVLASVMMRLSSSGIGIWALRQEEVDQLLVNAKAARN